MNELYAALWLQHAEYIKQLVAIAPPFSPAIQDAIRTTFASLRYARVHGCGPNEAVDVHAEGPMAA